MVIGDEFVFVKCGLFNSFRFCYAVIEIIKCYTVIGFIQFSNDNEHSILHMHGSKVCSSQLYWVSDSIA